MEDLEREFIYQEILEQPTIARRCADEPPESWPEAPGRTLITGAGDSLVAAELIRDVFPELRLEAPPVMSASEAASSLGSDDALIAISASGRTPRVVEAAERARGGGAAVVAVTDDPDSPVAEQAQRAWWIGATPRGALDANDYETEDARGYVGYHHDVAQTKSFVAILLKVGRAAAAAAGVEVDQEALVERVARLCQPAFFEPIQKISEACAESGQAFFLGAGSGLPLARFAAYKLFEFNRLAHFNDIEEYCHTHYFITRMRDAIVFMIGDAVDAHRAAEIAPVLTDLFHARIIALRCDDVPRPAKLGGADIPVPSGETAFERIVALAIGVEWLTYLWGRVDAPDINTFHAGYDTERLIAASMRTIRQSRIVP